jgi:hypothetical protein
LPSKQGTLRTVANVFRYHRLNPLGVLITNFSKPDISHVNILDSYSDLVSSYLYPKAMQESEDPDWNLMDGPSAHGLQAKCEDEAKSYFHLVKSDFGKYYGQYITRQIFDIASFNAPMSRFANSEMWSSLFGKTASEIAEGANILQHFVGARDQDDDGSEGDDGGYYISDPNMNALGWTTTALLDAAGDGNYPVLGEHSKKLAETWHQQLNGSPDETIKAKAVVHSYLMIRNKLTADGVIKPEMLSLVNGYDFMRNMHLFCDVPTSELALYPAIAQFAYPSHYNIAETRRFQYVADGKSTEMFMDVIPFDTCRYLYDWLPSTELMGDSFDIQEHQLAFRYALDGLVKHTVRYNCEYFFGTHVVGLDDGEFAERLLIPRVRIA